MNAVIIEDEESAVENLLYMLKKIEQEITIVKVLDSVKGAIEFLKKEPVIDLIFLDVHLADGISFEIFNHVTITTPVIFTTAYDEFALKAFSLNSVDYILKPIDQASLSKAIGKWEFFNKESNAELISSLVKGFNEQRPHYKNTLLVHYKDSLVPVKTQDIAFIYIDSGVVRVKVNTGEKYAMDKNLDEFEQLLDPQTFFRVNRQFIVHRNSVKTLTNYFNGKLILKTTPQSEGQIVISKVKST